LARLPFRAAARRGRVPRHAPSARVRQSARLRPARPLLRRAGPGAALSSIGRDAADRRLPGGAGPLSRGTGGGGRPDAGLDGPHWRQAARALRIHAARSAQPARLLVESAVRGPGSAERVGAAAGAVTLLSGPAVDGGGPC